MRSRARRDVVPVPRTAGDRGPWMQARTLSAWWRRRGGGPPSPWRGMPLGEDVGYCEVLASRAEIDAAVRSLGFAHRERVKSWDLHKSLHYLLRSVLERDSRILDAGSAGSPILGLLRDRGYTSLFGCDLVAAARPTAAGIRFARADLLRLPFPAGRFDAVTCLSVIEHGVDPEAFAAEMARILRAGGHLLVSTDYDERGLSTAGVDRAHTFGLPWTVFSRGQIEDFLRTARGHGLVLHEPMRWRTHGRPVRWNGLRYTFVHMVLRRV